MSDHTRVFLVARNPDADSKLPYLLRLPLEDGIVLKARESWPATARVYCHRFEGPWPEQVEIVEQTPVTLCRRRGIRPPGLAARAVFCVCQKIASRPFTCVKTNWERARRGRSSTRSIAAPRLRQRGTGLCSMISASAGQACSKRWQ